MGTVVFGNTTDTYAKFKDSVVTLFAVANGDSIWDVFNATSYGQHTYSAGSVYLVVIFLFFNLFMLRLILAVVETLYLYLCLFTDARRKRKEYRKVRLAKAAGSAGPIFYPGGSYTGSIMSDDNRDTEESTRVSLLGNSVRSASASWALKQAVSAGGGRQRHRSTVILKDLLNLVSAAAEDNHTSHT